MPMSNIAVCYTTEQHQTIPRLTCEHCAGHMPRARVLRGCSARPISWVAFCRSAPAEGDGMIVRAEGQLQQLCCVGGLVFGGAQSSRQLRRPADGIVQPRTVGR